MFEVGDLVEVVEAGVDHELIGKTVPVTKVESNGYIVSVHLKGAKNPWSYTTPLGPADDITDIIGLKIVAKNPEYVAQQAKETLEYYSAITGEP